MLPKSRVRALEAPNVINKNPKKHGGGKPPGVFASDGKTLASQPTFGRAFAPRPERWKSKTQRAASLLKGLELLPQEISAGSSRGAKKTEVLSIC